MDLTELGRRVRAAHAYSGLSAMELGRLLGVGRSRIFQIEAGRVIPKPSELDAIARICGFPLSWFFREPWGESNEENSISALNEVVDLLENAARESQRQEPEQDDQ